MSDTKLFSLKPEFNFKKNLFLNALAWLPVSVAGGVEAVLIYLSSPVAKEVAVMPGQVFFGVLAVVTLILLSFLVLLGFLNEKLTYKSADYSVFKTRIEFSEGVLGSVITSVMLVDVKELHLRRSLAQRLCGLGTIRFITTANSTKPFSSNINSTGVNFRDIKNPVEVYDEIKKLIAARKG